MDVPLILLLLCLTVAVALPASAAEASLTAWAVDPLEKVFPDATPPAEPGVVSLRAARGQTAGGQIALQVRGEAARATVTVEPLAGPGGRTIAADQVRWHFQGFIPLAHNTEGTQDVLRKAPCDVPDVLLADRELTVAPDQTQPVWIGVDVPEDCPPGEYRGHVRVRAGDREAAVPLAVRVHDFALPRERHLWVTNWFSPENIATAHRLEIWSEPFWEMLGRYARMMAAHRQNVVLVPLNLIRLRRAADGKLAFDFTRFDRYARLFIAAGAGERLEIGFTAHFGEGGWSSKEILLNRVTATDAATGKMVTLEPEEGLGPLLRALEAHLKRRGWLDRALIHICDEPSAHNLASWRRASEFVHRHAPGIRRIDAIETTGFEGALEVWVPKLNHLNTWYPTYRQAQQAGAELWYYTCCHPFTVYPNRFLDFALLKTRVLHWINYAYDLPGYLHGGLNFWGQEPFGAPAANLPPGDTHIAYPGPEGPLSSLRWEAMREGIEDYEWLHLLAERTAAVQRRLGKPAQKLDAAEGAHAFARLIVRSFTDYEQSPSRFHAVREALAGEIEAVDKPPLLLVNTNPPGGSELVSGPIVLQVRGAVVPGAAVTVNGEAVTLDPDGGFWVHTSPAADGTVTIEATHDGQSKRVVRQFRLRH